MVAMDRRAFRCQSTISFSFVSGRDGKKGKNIFKTELSHAFFFFFLPTEASRHLNLFSSLVEKKQGPKHPSLKASCWSWSSPTGGEAGGGTAVSSYRARGEIYVTLLWSVPQGTGKKVWKDCN